MIIIMPFRFAISRLNFLKFLTVFISACPLFGIELSDSLIESSILINLNEFEEEPTSSEKSRRYSSSYVSNENNASITSEIKPENFNTIEDLMDKLESIYTSMDEDKIDGFDHSIHYMIELANNQKLSYSELLTMVRSSVLSILRSDIDNSPDIISNIPNRLIENFFLDPQLSSLQSNNGESASVLMNNLGKILMESVMQQYPENAELASESFIMEVLSIMDNYPEDNIPLTDFYPGIVPIPYTADEANDDMKFDGGFRSHYQFDPAKTRILSMAANGLAKGIGSFNLVDLDLKDQRVEGEKTLEPNLANSILKPVLDNILSRTGDNRLFAFEVAKVISSSVSQVVTNQGVGSDEADSFAEAISKDLADAAVQSGIDNRASLTEFGRNLGQLAESVGVGTSMGVQLAAVDDQIMDYEPGFQAYSRKNLAMASSKGTSAGAIMASAESATIDDESGEPIIETQDLKEIASHAAMGSILGHTAMSIYYPTPENLFPIINYSAQGSSLGSTTVLPLASLRPEDPENETESPTVEVARASSHGAALGASFEIIALTDANPADKSYDKDSILAVQAASYGSTYGVVLGATEGGESDSVVLKQAAKQGATEGALAGSGLATLYDEEYFNNEANFGGANGETNTAGQASGSYDSVALSSKKSIIDAISTVNAQAAVDASTKLATKSIKTSSQDMIRLIQKFNISPRFTNPTRIFQGNKNQKFGNDFPFEDQFPVASPI